MVPPAVIGELRSNEWNHEAPLRNPPKARSVIGLEPKLYVSPVNR